MMLFWAVSMNVYALAPEYCDYNDCEYSAAGAGPIWNIVFWIIGLLIVFAVGKAFWRLVSGQEDEDTESVGGLIIWYIHMAAGSALSLLTLWPYISSKTHKMHLPIEAHYYLYVAAACSAYMLFSKTSYAQLQWWDYIFIGVNFAAALGYLI